MLFDRRTGACPSLSEERRVIPAVAHHDVQTQSKDHERIYFLFFLTGVVETDLLGGGGELSKT